MAPSPWDDLTPELAAGVLAVVAHDARVKQAGVLSATGSAIGSGLSQAADTIKGVAGSGVDALDKATGGGVTNAANAVGSAASSAGVATSSIVAKAREWLKAHPEMQAPLAGAGIGAALAGGNALVRKKRNPMGAALLGGLTGAGIGGAYSAISGAMGADKRTADVEKTRAGAEANRQEELGATGRTLERTGLSVAGKAVGSLAGDGAAIKDVGGMAAEHPVAALGAAAGAAKGVMRGRDRSLLANIRANTHKPGDVDALFPKLPAWDDAKDKLIEVHNPQSDVANNLSRNLADPAYQSRGQLWRDRGLKGLLSPSTQLGRQAGEARTIMRNNPGMWTMARPPAGGGLAPGAATRIGQISRGIGGGVAGAGMGLLLEQGAKGLGTWLGGSGR